MAEGCPGRRQPLRAPQGAVKSLSDGVLSSRGNKDLRNNINEHTKQRQTHRHGEQTVVARTGAGRGPRKVRGLSSADGSYKLVPGMRRAAQGI